MNCRFQRLKKKLAVAGLPLPGLCATAFRYGFATRSRKRGVGEVVTSELMGHVDTTQVARTHQHVTADREYLRSQLKKLG